MPANKRRNESVRSRLWNTITSLSDFGASRRNRTARRKDKGRSLNLEGLEKREMFSVNQLWFTAPAADLTGLNAGLKGNMLVVATDNASTSVAVSKVGSNIRVTEVGTDRFWDYAASKVNAIEFQGGNGNDRFANYISTLPVRAFGGNGDDFLSGNDAGDALYGGSGNDYLASVGGNDNLWGNDGNDTLLGGNGNDNLMGGAGNDHLNGQGGNDNLWGEAGSDTMISIDAGVGDYLDGGANADVLWIDQLPSLNLPFGIKLPGATDRVVNSTSGDVLQNVVSFANGADKTLDGDIIANPKGAGATTPFNNRITAGNTSGTHPLFGSNGPVSQDIKQGAIGDCWLLAGLGAVTRADANVIRENVVDFNDGTYGVRLGNNIYREGNDFSGVGAGLGNNGEMWVAVVEKAFAQYRGGSYADLKSGGATEAFSAFRMKNIGSQALRSLTTSANMLAELISKWQQGYALTIGSIVYNGVGGGTHEFSVEGFTRDAAGKVIGVVLRNPWGWDGLKSFNAFASAVGGTDQNDGFFTVTATQLFNSGGRLLWGQA